ncbi:Glutathione S-transferase-like protein gedE [Colletotrichum aenigma]|uniref:Glutathione S-transferase-like protein gedE n=1 Tax=Colletotrichum aenigma TaxID=1215731 RepID=UPI001872F6C8|nr:Glutathione S-transferase-like protein gedE [Colletotrichum aenigma]KAF5501867.1 Glutathione S-transferase-like protein gedE [Colletotrichum aenigma]
MSLIKPVTVYVLGGGPNPFKVLITLEELGIPYEKIEVEDVKSEAFLKLNPNGRTPVITDPNNDNFTLWESGAIVEYLVEKYDALGSLTLKDKNSRWLLQQYLHFQMSGQGPYYGQAVWFYRQTEDIPTAKHRYIEQVLRVFGVLDGILKDREYLVGGKCTYADLSFIPWNLVALGAPFFKDELWEKHEIKTRFPHFLAWHERLNARPSVKAAYGA